MAISNKELIFSLTQDLKQVKNICNEIQHKYQDLRLKSWLNPSKTYEETEALQSGTNFKYDPYTLCMELLLDRLYLFVNLIVHHLDTLSVHWEHKLKNIKKPNNISLGAILSILWDKLINLELVLTANEMNIIPTCSQCDCLSSETQTEIPCITSCDSCDIAKQCIRSICEAIMKAINFSNVEKARDRINSELFDLTQFGCMNLLVTSISQDIEKLLVDNKYLECLNVRLREESIKLNEEKNTFLATIDSLETKLKFLEEDLETEKFRSEELKQDLEKSATHLKETQDNAALTSNEYDKSIQILKEELKIVKLDKEHADSRVILLQQEINEKTENAHKNTLALENLHNHLQIKNETIHKLEEQLRYEKSVNNATREIVKQYEEDKEQNKIKTDNLNGELNKLSKYVEEWKIKNVNLCAVNQKIMKENQLYSLEIENLKLKFNQINENLKNIELAANVNNDILKNKLTDYTNSVQSFKNVIESNLKANVDERNVKGDISDVKISMEKDIKVNGDPLSDMINQFETNNKNITILQDQNISLEKVINRLKKIKRCNINR